jgi:hypothetical protein
MTPKIQATKAKVNKCESMKIKILYKKRNNCKMKRQSVTWVKIFVNHIFDRQLISKMQKELKELSSKSQNNYYKKT